MRDQQAVPRHVHILNIHANARQNPYAFVSGWSLNRHTNVTLAADPYRPPNMGGVYRASVRLCMIAQTKYSLHTHPIDDPHL